MPAMTTGADEPVIATIQPAYVVYNGSDTCSAAVLEQSLTPPSLRDEQITESDLTYLRGIAIDKTATVGRLLRPTSDFEAVG